MHAFLHEASRNSYGKSLTVNVYRAWRDPDEKRVKNEERKGIHAFWVEVEGTIAKMALNW